MTNEPISEHDFERAADLSLRALERALGELDGLEADLQSGILTIEFPDGGKYIINSHRAARQIWMAAESSAWHFDFARTDGTWKASKSGDELWAALRGVLARRLRRDVELTAPAV